MEINLNVRSASVILSILLISGCSNGKLRIGEPPENGVIHAIEKAYPDKSGMMVSSWPYVTLHADSDTFVFLKKFCEEKNYNFENILPSLGWCISDDEYPLFFFSMIELVAWELERNQLTLKSWSGLIIQRMNLKFYGIIINDFEIYLSTYKNH